MSELKEYKAYEYGTSYVYDIREVKEAIAELKAEIESLKASHYAEMVDAGMRERRLRMALWLARAERAKDKQQYENVCRLDGWVHRENKWLEVERLCMAKAEEYK